MAEIKICGIRSPIEAKYLNDARVEYAGCVFHKPSKRYVTFDEAAEVLKALDKRIKRVAVTVSPDKALIKEIERSGFDILQVHKSLSEEVIREANIPIWYACNIEDEEGLTEALTFLDGLPSELADKITGIVADAKEFGSGKTFNWKGADDKPEDIPYRKSKRLLKAGAQSPPDEVKQSDGYNNGHNDGHDNRNNDEHRTERLFILAGGLNEDNVAEGIRIFKPDIVDVSSGVEGAGGKDKDKITAFVKAVRSSENQITDQHRS